MGDVPSVGEVLRSRFLEPNGITAYQLAKAMGKGQSMLTNIMSGKRGVTPETAVLLGKTLGTSAEYWLAIDARYQLSKIEEDDMSGVERVVERNEDTSICESGGWTYSNFRPTDAMLGRAVRGAMMGAGHLEPNSRKALLDSIEQYVMYSIISVPGEAEYMEYKEDVPTAAMCAYEQFLIAAGEDPSVVDELVHAKRVDIYGEAGTFDEDGVPRQYNWRGARTVDLRHVGKLLEHVSVMDEDARQEVFDCLLAYTSDDVIRFPEDDNAFMAFKMFLERCEGFGRVYDVLRADMPEYAKMPYAANLNDGSEASL